MSALWTHIRRLAASLMLVAVASLVLHGAAAAGFHLHSPDTADCAVSASSQHEHRQAAAHAASEHIHSAGHHHGGASHHHATADLAEDPSSADRQAHGKAGTECCDSICAFAVVAIAPDAMSAPMGVAQAPVPDSQTRSGIDPSGLKRPPRTPCIA